MLRNHVATTELTVTQIAAHLMTRSWNITRELQKSEAGEPGRLAGRKAFNDGPGRGGQWRIDRQRYLDHLGIPADQRGPGPDGNSDHLDADGLPRLYIFEHPRRPVSAAPTAAALLRLTPELLKVMVRQCRLPYVVFGRSWYLTHNQLERTRVLLHESPAYLAHLQDAPAGANLDISYRQPR